MGHHRVERGQAYSGRLWRVTIKGVALALLLAIGASGGVGVGEPLAAQARAVTARTAPSSASASSASSASASSAPSSLALYFGLMYPGTPGVSALGAYEAQLSKQVSLVLWYQSWIEQGQQQAFPTAQMEALREQGVIPVLAWEPDAYPPPASEPEFSLQAIASGSWDAYIQQWALAAKAWGRPFFLRFASEMNGSWTPWSEMSNGNSAGQFVAAWRHVHDIFTAVGATNVTWVWCPNTADATTTPLTELYPGDAYVDWVGMDGYNFSVDLNGAPWHSFAQVFASTYAQLLALAPSKPIMIGETGSVEDGGSKANWITDALTTQLPAQFPRVKALIWFDSADGKFDLRYDTSASSLAAFRVGIASNVYEANNYSALDQSPIPPPALDVQTAPTPTSAAASAATRTPTTATNATSPTLTYTSTGPAAGYIALLNAQTRAPLVGATLTYAGAPAQGHVTTTNAHGLSQIPGALSAPVLVRVTIGAVVAPTRLPLNLHMGYELDLNLATGQIVRALAHAIGAASAASAASGGGPPWWLWAAVAALVALLAPVGTLGCLGVRRRRARSPASRTLM